MCGRYLVITEDEIIEMRSILEELNQRFYESDELDLQSYAGGKSAEIVPSLVAPVLVAKEDALHLQPMKWGFSRWDGKGSIINARVESVQEKSFFRESFNRRRCIIPSRGFFEWKKPSPAPLLDMTAPPEHPLDPGKYFIRRNDSPLFFMAGIYNKTDDMEEFVILTMPANLQIAPIHDRMPVYLNNPQLLTWLQDPKTISQLLENQASQVQFAISRAGTGKEA